MNDKGRETDRERVSKYTFVAANVMPRCPFMQSLSEKASASWLFASFLPGHLLHVTSVPRAGDNNLLSLGLVESATGCEGCHSYELGSSGLSSQPAPHPCDRLPMTRRLRGECDISGEATAQGACTWKCLPRGQTPQLYWCPGLPFPLRLMGGGRIPAVSPVGS